MRIHAAYSHTVFSDLSLAELTERARSLRDEGKGRLVTYSPKVFIPLTKLCRDVCHYCTFAAPPRRGERAYMSADEVLDVARAGAAAGCREALFTLGDKPERRYRAARDELAELGCSTTIEYLVRMCRLVLEETGLLPHANPGVMTRAELAALREVTASQGIMLETASDRLSERGGPHFGSPDKRPAVRLETMRLAGELRIPFTTGILIGIGETREERIEALVAIRDLHERYGHIQEVIVQNFRAKPGTKMAGAPEPSLDEELWTAAAARLVLGAEMNIQAPPNLSYEDFPRLLDAGINDWGGVSPVTIDHVNPEAPWPEIERLESATRAAGLELAARLPVYPEYVDSAWIDPMVMPHVLAAADSVGLAREGEWTPGADVAIPFVPRDALPVDSRDELGEEEIARLFRARGSERDRVFAAADRLRREVNGDTVTYVVTRNIQYTNVCYFKCGFCAFSKGKLAENLRGPAYLLPLEEIVRRVEEAWERGAVEVCLQGGIHPAFDGDYYLSVVRAIKDAVPGIHVHAFSALELWQGAATLGLPLDEYLAAAARRRSLLAAGNGGGGAGRRGAARHLPRQGDDRPVAPRARHGAPARPRLEQHDHVRARRRPRELGAPLAARARTAAGEWRLHGVHPAAVRAHGGADVPQGARPPRPDLRRVPAHARGGPVGAASLDHERPGLVGEGGAGRRRGGVARGRERPRRDAHERVDLSRGRCRVRPGDAARAHGGDDPGGRSRTEAANDALR